MSLPPETTNSDTTSGHEPTVSRNDSYEDR
jgi:hypothetical protein